MEVTSRNEELKAEIKIYNDLITIKTDEGTTKYTCNPANITYTDGLEHWDLVDVFIPCANKDGSYVIVLYLDVAKDEYVAMSVVKEHGHSITYKTADFYLDSYKGYKRPANPTESIEI
jgi:hypothetical protein